MSDGRFDKKSGRQGAWGREREKQPVMQEPSRSVWCAKCHQAGTLPVAVFSKSGDKVQEQIGACDCVWGEYQRDMLGKCGLQSYYSLPDALVDKEAKSYTGIMQRFRENRDSMWELIHERRKEKEECRASDSNSKSGKDAKNEKGARRGKANPGRPPGSTS